jgi:hypothetical protein
MSGLNLGLKNYGLKSGLTYGSVYKMHLGYGLYVASAFGLHTKIQHLILGRG